MMFPRHFCDSLATGGRWVSDDANKSRLVIVATATDLFTERLAAVVSK
jgi:hypothetical protein